MVGGWSFGWQSSVEQAVWDEHMWHCRDKTMWRQPPKRCSHGRCHSHSCSFGTYSGKPCAGLGWSGWVVMVGGWRGVRSDPSATEVTTPDHHAHRRHNARGWLATVDIHVVSDARYLGHENACSGQGARGRGRSCSMKMK